MRYYPVYLDIKDRDCLVIGGGSVGTRKILTLLSCGANVTVVSTAATEKLHQLSNNGVIKLKERPFQTTDLDDRFLVIGATDNQELNFNIHAEAERRGLLCNIADRPKVCNFILPSIVNRGDLIIAISTSGKSPAFAKKLRKHLEKEFGDEYAELLKLMGAIRKKLLSQDHEPEAHKHLFEQLIERNLVQMLKEGDTESINSLLLEVLGEGYEFESLTSVHP
ncbi:MAG: bifunctional precorrin-2 dehydrogenase/sirohydrochlorin ferrochelatase [Desulfobacteraceae bacterium]|nr:bifunctional precorrin-2 dehydrogenase/sirohydrochlorin ferrochelatase [Desulfobacteraceae bacterium]MDH3573751.1 bifunctional precorrin-2 dehydrogenase/sirohydrochlorin ferrochelatase [Desulfobacteraceae bacterium]MDH3721343.1 bifunctional precorrin-2 dehydrogenase/sirohydrochlorin ferrochelatase [Desulfobacteraceae bacterium]MDH3835777.1 bifunctional precorrin-2 dehydrogenase/sirohydrochlorin ferrochelatase [Desulfobacteraceae bacterium]MDH3880548.1 bifunctional precorrin-2 dehydrogenase/s